MRRRKTQLRAKRVPPEAPRFILKSWHYVVGAETGIRVFTTDNLAHAKRALRDLNRSAHVGDTVVAIAEVEMARQKREAASEKRRAFVRHVRGLKR